MASLIKKIEMDHIQVTLPELYPYVLLMAGTISF